MKWSAMVYSDTMTKLFSSEELILYQNEKHFPVHFQLVILLFGLR